MLKANAVISLPLDLGTPCSHSDVDSKRSAHWAKDDAEGNLTRRMIPATSILSLPDYTETNKEDSLSGYNHDSSTEHRIIQDMLLLKLIHRL